MTSFGPADLYVVEFPSGSSPSEVTATLREVTSAGVLTLLDVAVVRHGDGGAREVVELDQLAGEFDLSGATPEADGLIGEDDLLELTEDLAPGAIALAVLVENTWARKIATAMRDSDARPLSVQRFPAEVVNEVATAAGLEV
ncbi:DUF6325 family protein [Tessaracoccus palaemonis]|uniref:DUF1269 domain-containing protein n=1 Tax=Tessaracoccus palaemonis TaxID=2829499 RepID=A0ABX8SK07_9ACTN|nr:DUF6325 family protein [Tessaracoccus palaemonis]QXT62478.1 hypothetical protein KDB89_12120 [Tessaracoccus palaemonis]